jgi:hypothetical protein
VQFHSIIGLAPANNSLLSLARVFAKVEDWSDGVVPYYSAHLDGTASELLVQADHTHVHQHPLAILEVRRILLDHWKAVNGPR